MAGKKQAGPSAKAVAGKAKKDEQEAKKQAVEDGKKAAAEDVEWSKGANNKKASRDDAAASKADETARKKREKEALQAAEEEELGQGGSSKKTTTGPKKKGKPKSDLGMLEDALVKSGEKKFKKTKEDMLSKKKKEAEIKKKEPVALDPLLANTQSMIGDMGNGELEEVGRNANKARMEAEASGIDAALDTMKIKTPGGATSSKALYNEFEERMLPQVKDEYPGLRLSQMKEKVWNLWKKSAENPANQVPKDGAPAKAS
jgi:hypothetical protein